MISTVFRTFFQKLQSGNHSRGTLTLIEGHVFNCPPFPFSTEMKKANEPTRGSFRQSFFGKRALVGLLAFFSFRFWTRGINVCLVVIVVTLPARLLMIVIILINHLYGSDRFATHNVSSNPIITILLSLHKSCHSPPQQTLSWSASSHCNAMACLYLDFSCMFHNNRK